jgi:hypothetical protein
VDDDVVDQGACGLTGLSRVFGFCGLVQGFDLAPVNLAELGVQGW